MWSDWKSWLVNHCWNVFSLDKWKKRSQTFAVLLGVAFVLSVAALLVSLWTHLHLQHWTETGAVVLVPKQRIVQINGHDYIPIRLLA